jgi:hypothetical protein
MQHIGIVSRSDNWRAKPRERLRKFMNQFGFDFIFGYVRFYKGNMRLKPSSVMLQAFELSPTLRFLLPNEGVAISGYFMTACAGYLSFHHFTKRLHEFQFHSGSVMP